MKLSIGILTYNRSEILGLVLKELEKQFISNERLNEIEVVVIDNNSSDETPTIIENYSSVFRCFIEKKLGLSHARNRFIRESKGQYLAFLDDDAIVAENWLDNLLLVINQYPEVDFFGGRILPEKNITLPKWFDVNFHCLYSIQDLGHDVIRYPKKKGPVGANMIISKRRLKDHIFDPSIGRVGNSLLSGGETELFHRLGFKSNEAIYAGNVAVYHNFSHVRYQKDWALERFSYDGLSSRLMFTKTRSIRQLLSPFYQCLKSLFTENSFYIKCNFVKLFSFISGRSIVNKD